MILPAEHYFIAKLEEVVMKHPSWIWEEIIWQVAEEMMPSRRGDSLEDIVHGYKRDFFPEDFRP